MGRNGASDFAERPDVMFINGPLCYEYVRSCVRAVRAYLRMCIVLQLGYYDVVWPRPD